MKSVEKSHCAKTGLLGHILGVVIIARQPARQVKGGVQMR